MHKGINPNIKTKSKVLKTLDQYLEGLRNSNRYILSEVLTLVESKNITQRKLGEKILKTIDPSQFDNTIRIGITGSPGAGKSTFIESLGSLLTSRGKKVAVLAIDPSSPKNLGSILGDKTRMTDLSRDENAYVRPTSTANVLGGVAQATKESISICEAAGYDIILIESVGVGQSETVLAELVDIYLLILLPGGGDGVQAIKRGVVELADILVVNKCDGGQESIAKQSQRDFKGSIRLFQHALDKWDVPVNVCSSISGNGINHIWTDIKRYTKLSKTNNHFIDNRKSQDKKWIFNQIRENIILKSETLFNLNQYSTYLENDKSIFDNVLNAKKNIEKDFHHFREKKDRAEN